MSDVNVKNTLVTLHKVVTAVVPGVSPEEVEGTNPEDIWEIANGDPSLIRESSTEVVGAGNANGICHVCFAPLKVEGKGSISIILSEGTEITSLEGLDVQCSVDASHEVPRELSEEIARDIRRSIVSY